MRRQPQHPESDRPLRLPRLPHPARQADGERNNSEETDPRDDTWIHEWSLPHSDNLH
jgi:hypothetical protein